MSATAQLEKTHAELSQHVQRRPGRKRKRPVSLPEISALCRDDDSQTRVKASDLSLALQGDPLGLRSGEYRARSKWGVGDATPERHAQAKRKHVQLVTEEARTPEGARTGDRRKRFLKLLESRGTLDHSDKLAAERLQVLFVMAYGSSPAQFGYEHRVPSGMRELQQQEQQWEAQSLLAQVRARIPRWLLPIIDVIQRDAYEDTDLSELAPYYAPNLGNKRARDKLNDLLQVCCKLLSDIFELQNEWDDRTRKVAQEVLDMNGRGLW